MRRITSILLTSALTIGMAVSLIGCGESEEEKETATEKTEAVVSEEKETETTESETEDAETTTTSEEIKIVSFSCDKEGQEIEVGSGELITFTAEIESNVKLRNGDVQLIANDSLGRENSYNMSDNGKSSDDVADDGIYSCGLFNTLDEPLTTAYHVVVNGTVNSDTITLETHEKEKTASADELGITSDEMANLFLAKNIPAHHFADMDTVQEEVEMGAKMAFDNDSTNFSYSAAATDYYGLAVWTDNDNSIAGIAERAINGDESAKQSWDNLKDLSINQAEFIDLWTGITLDDESYHTAVAIMNDVNTSLVVLVVYDDEILYDATE